MSQIREKKNWSVAKEILATPGYVAHLFFTI